LLFFIILNINNKGQFGSSLKLGFSKMPPITANYFNSGQFIHALYA